MPFCVKKLITRQMLKARGIDIDRHSTINRNVKTTPSFKSAKIINSNMQIDVIGDGCFIEHATGYGHIELGNYVSISGPGTILHSVNGKIRIGSFSSIAENVSIQEFNHDMSKVTTAAVQLL